MEKLAIPGRLFFAMALVGFGVQQFVYGDFVAGRAPAWTDGVPGKLGWAYLSGGIFIASGLAIVAQIKGREAAILSGLLIFVWALLRHVPVVVSAPNGVTITMAGKALALFGGAFAIAGSLSEENAQSPRSKWDLLSLLTANRLIWTGRICVGVFLIIGGVEHFIYPQFVATLVPAWIPGATFWTYFAGVALIAGGVGMIAPPTVRAAAASAGLMVFLWVLLLHIPRAVAAAEPAAARNEWTAVLEALAISGVAFVIAGFSCSQLSRDVEK